MIMKVEKITNVTVEKNTLKREASELISNGIMKMLEKNNAHSVENCSSHKKPFFKHIRNIHNIDQNPRLKCKYCQKSYQKYYLL